MEPIKRRGNPNMVSGKPSVNPSGRPVNGTAMALRELESQKAAAEFADALVRNPDAAISDRRWAAIYIRDTCDGLPISTSVSASQAVVSHLDLGASGHPPTLPDRWDSMTPLEKRTYVRSLRDGNPG